MKSYTFLLTLILLGAMISLSSCAQANTRPSEPDPTEAYTPEAGPAPTVEPTATLTVPPTVEPSPAPVDTPAPAPSTATAIRVLAGDGLNHELVFAIRNAGRYSGEGGQPGWLGWGADNLAVAPDGSFWIADTPADPDRLLHYGPQGDLLQVIPMLFEGHQYWARDVAVDSSGVWVLDYLSQPNLVLHINPEVGLPARYEIPDQFSTHIQEGNVMPGLWHIPFAENGKVLLDGPAGIVEMTLEGVGVSFQAVAGYRLGGHTYAEVENGLLVDDRRVGMTHLQPDHFLNNVWLLGVAADGSFYLRADESNTDQGKAEPPDRYVRRYRANGDLLGIALLPLPELDQVTDTALGPDGNIYVLHAHADHSVEILRLSFYPGAPPLLSPFTSFPSPSFTPLLPSDGTLSTDLDGARQAMLAFFSSLAERRYEQAAPFFGGSYEAYKGRDEAISADQPGMAWDLICQMEFCLAVTDILDSRLVAPDEYEFLVGFVTENGIRFDYGICCGNFQSPPAVTWFVYSVKVHQINGQWLVMGGPLPHP